MCGHVNICASNGVYVSVCLSRSAQDKFLFSLMAHANGDRQIDFRDKDVDLQGHFPLVSARDFWIIFTQTLPLLTDSRNFQ